MIPKSVVLQSRKKLQEHNFFLIWTITNETEALNLVQFITILQ